MSEGMSDGTRICVGVIGAPHGVRGEVRLKSFTADPEDIVAYGQLTDETGNRQFALTLTGWAKGMLVARIKGVGDRSTAEALKGTELYVDRALLPELEEEEYYHADLIGLEVEDVEGRPQGKVKTLDNFGAGDVMEVELTDGTSLVVPFTRRAVPEIDLEGGRVVIDPPQEIEGEFEAESEEDGGATDREGRG